MERWGSMEISNVFQVPSVHVCLLIVTWRKMSFFFKIWCTNCRYDKNNVLPGGESIWEFLTHFSTTQIPPNLCPNLLKTLGSKDAQGWEIWLRGGDISETWGTAGSRPPYREGPRGGDSISHGIRRKTENWAGMDLPVALWTSWSVDSTMNNVYVARVCVVVYRVLLGTLGYVIYSLEPPGSQSIHSSALEG